MRKHFGYLLGLILSMAVAGAASATPFSATLGIGIGALGTLPFTATGTGTSTTAPNAVTIPSGLFTGAVSVPVTGNAPITAVGVTLAGNGPMAFSGTPLGGTGAVLGGSAIIGDLGGGPVTLVGVPFFTTHAIGSATGVSIGVGIGGSFYTPVGTAAYLALQNNAWTTGTVMVTGLENTFTYHVAAGMMASVTNTYTFFNGTSTFAGTDSRTPGGLGQVTLVAPSRVATNLTGGLLVLVALGSLTVNFVPEPGTLLLLGSGVAGLALLGRRRSN